MHIVVLLTVGLFYVRYSKANTNQQRSLRKDELLPLTTGVRQGQPKSEASSIGAELREGVGGEAWAGNSPASVLPSSLLPTVL